jgi:prepilin-type N-terminal cleavage/methylation domain-containing protein
MKPTTRDRLRLDDQRGMTVAEILVALVIISVGLVGLASVLPISSYGIQQGNQLSTATFLAEQRLEQIKGLAWTASPNVDCLGASSNWSFGGGGATPTIPYTNPPGATCGSVPSLNDETPTSNPLPSPYGNYTRQVRIRDCSAAGSGCGVSDNRIRMVTVQVSFIPLQGVGGVALTQPQSIQLTTLMAQR